MHLLLLLFASILTSNIALSYFLGMCPFITISKNMRVAFGMGMAVSFVMTMTALANWVVYYYILLPLQLDYLQFLVFIINIATIVQLIEIFIDRFSPSLYDNIGVHIGQ